MAIARLIVAVHIGDDHHTGTDSSEARVVLGLRLQYRKCTGFLYARRVGYVQDTISCAASCQPNEIGASRAVSCFSVTVWSVFPGECWVRCDIAF